LGFYNEKDSKVEEMIDMTGFLFRKMIDDCLLSNFIQKF